MGFTAQKLSPQKQKIFFEIENAYVGKKDFKKAKEVAKQAYDLAPQNKEAVIMYAVAGIVSGDQKLADEFLTKAFGKTAVPDERLASAYLVAKKYAKAIEIFEAIKVEKPQFAQQIDAFINQLP